MAKKKTKLRKIKYKSCYCQMLVDHMSKGGTIKSFAKKIGISINKLADWTAKHPELMEAKDEGHYRSRMFNRQNLT